MAIVPTRYYKHTNRLYDGNPLIEVLPEIDPVAMRRLLTSSITFSPDERDHPTHVRMQYLWRLDQAFLPFPHHVAFASHLVDAINAGYCARNPRRKETSRDFHNFCEELVAGTLKPDESAFVDSPQGVSLIGTPGMGKTRVLRALERMFHSEPINHTSHVNLFQVFLIRVECPDKEGFNGLLREIYRVLREKVDQLGLAIPIPKRALTTRADLEDAIGVLARKLNLGLLAVDEIQHLLGGAKRIEEHVMKWLTGFMNRLRIPVLVIGTWPAYAVLGKELRLQRRATSLASAEFRRLTRDSREWSLLMDMLFRCQWVRKPVALTDELSSAFYEHSQGILDLAIKLMMVCQAEAMRTRGEEISAPLVERAAAKHMALVAPAIAQLRNGRGEDDPLLWDVEPTQFGEYIKALMEEYSQPENRPRRQSGQKLAVRTLPFESAEPLPAVASQPIAPRTTEAAASAVTSVPAPRVRSKRTGQSLADMDRRANALEDADLRKVVYLALRKAKTKSEGIESAAEALFNHGDISAYAQEACL